MKRAAFLRDLSSEHHQALVLSRKIAQAGDQAGAALVAEVRSIFTAELEPHFRVEEETLLPALIVAGETELVAQTLADHRSLRKLVERLDQRGALAEFGAQLKAHVHFEERELFEACQALFDDLD
jgi:hypothetical protein